MHVQPRFRNFKFQYYHLRRRADVARALRLIDGMSSTGLRHRCTPVSLRIEAVSKVVACPAWRSHFHRFTNKCG
ncbi:hypothetical protein PTI98_011459 [Pleurotus ostreatus]|nr:hypothetical protein PTI98_011459 [Pleurotus ostreatus]